MILAQDVRIRPTLTDMQERPPFPGCPTLRFLKGGIPQNLTSWDFYTAITAPQVHSTGVICALARQF